MARRRRGQETPGAMVVPADLLPITAKARRLAHLAGRPYPPAVLAERSRALDAWFRERGVRRTDWAARTEAIQRGREVLKIAP